MLEAALAAPARMAELAGTFTVHVPLGQTGATSVFLVRDEGSVGRLLRLKVWRSRAPDDFLRRFGELQQQLADWRHPIVALPVAAYVDAEGRPAVLTEFRQGVPISDSVRSGLDPRQALVSLRPLIEAVRTAHSSGLVHGSLVAGNIIVHPRTRMAHLLDFGLAAVVSAVTDRPAPVASDRDRLAALVRTLRGRRGGPAAPGRL
jgi:serine/threonine protein kinase